MPFLDAIKGAQEGMEMHRSLVYPSFSHVHPLVRSEKGVPNTQPTWKSEYHEFMSRTMARNISPDSASLFHLILQSSLLSAAPT